MNSLTLQLENLVRVLEAKKSETTFPELQTRAQTFLQLRSLLRENRDAVLSCIDGMQGSSRTALLQWAKAVYDEAMHHDPGKRSLNLPSVR